MSTSVAGDFETPRPSHRGGAKKAVIVVAKLLVTGACFWYVSRQIDWRQVLSAIPLLNFRWAALAILVAMLEIPLSGQRWGLRELAVVSVLAGYGVAPERALLFSVCFGLALAVGLLPGAVA